MVKFEALCVCSFVSNFFLLLFIVKYKLSLLPDSEGNITRYVVYRVLHSSGPIYEKLAQSTKFDDTLGPILQGRLLESFFLPFKQNATG